MASETRGADPGDVIDSFEEALQRDERGAAGRVSRRACRCRRSDRNAGLEIGRRE